MTMDFKLALVGIIPNHLYQSQHQSSLGCFSIDVRAALGMPSCEQRQTLANGGAWDTCAPASALQ